MLAVVGGGIALLAQTPSGVEQKTAYSVSVVVPPAIGTADGEDTFYSVVGITDSGTIYFLGSELSTRPVSLRKRLPDGQITTLLAPGSALPGGGTCLRIDAAVLGPNNDLVLTLLMSGTAPAPQVVVTLPPARDPLPRDAKWVPYRQWVYFLPRDTAVKPATIADAVPITAIDEPAPGGGWIYAWKNLPQIAADGTVLIGAVVAAPPARFDAYYVLRPAAKAGATATLAGPLVSSVQGSKPLYAGGAGFFTLGPPAMDETGNLVFAAEPAASVVPATPDFGLYRLPRALWEPTVAGTGVPAFPLPTPTRLLGAKEADPANARDLVIDGSGIEPSLSAAGDSIYFRAQVKNESAPRIYEAKLSPDGSASPGRLVVGGVLPSPDGSRWNAIDPPILRLPGSGMIFAGRSEKGATDGTPLWRWRPEEGISLVARPQTPSNREGLGEFDLHQGRLISRSGVFVFSFRTTTKAGKVVRGIATAAPR